MKRLAIILLFIVAAGLLTSCDPNRVNDNFLKNYDVHLKMDGNIVIRFDPLLHQQGFNRQDARFQVSNDDFSQYYCINLSTVPTSTGQQVKADIFWYSTDGTQKSKNNVTLEAVKLEGDKIWLWNRQEGVEALVQVLD